MTDTIIITPAELDLLEKSLQSVAGSVNSLQQITYALIPFTGLDTTLQKFCDAINKTKAVQLAYTAFNLNTTTVTYQKALVIYNTVVELVVNILKHSSAKNATVHIERKGPVLHITVGDDGDGFDEAVIIGTAGNGYKKMKADLQAVNGSIKKLPTRQKGSLVGIQVPLGEQAS